jgi:hypothetical protein
MKKFSKAFGEVEVINTTNTTTTVIIIATGEQKVLVNKFANLSDTPFEAEVKVKKVSVIRELTNEEQEHISIGVEKQMIEANYYAKLSPTAKAEYRKNKLKSRI